MVELIVNLVVLVLVLAVVGGVLPQAVRVVRDTQRLVVFRLGKCDGAQAPGRSSSSRSSIAQWSSTLRGNVRRDPAPELHHQRQRARPDPDFLVYPPGRRRRPAA